MRSDRLHADDTPVQVLDTTVRQTRGKAKAVKEGRLWVYVRDDRPWGGTDPPVAAYYFSPDRKGEHPQGHLARFTGILQADAYGGFAKLYEPTLTDAMPRVREASCRAHLRRDSHDVWKATGSPIARDALERIGRLYDIEREIDGAAAGRRRDVRQARSRPHVDAFRTWCERQLAGIPGKGDLARAMRYALKRWDAFTLFLDVTGRSGPPSCADVGLRRCVVKDVVSDVACGAVECGRRFGLAPSGVAGGRSTRSFGSSARRSRPRRGSPTWRAGVTCRGLRFTSGAPSWVTGGWVTGG